MKKILFIYLISILFLNPSKASFEIKASTAILQDFLSKKILYEKNSDQSIYPASMTKIMTAIIAFELI